MIDSATAQQALQESKSLDMRWAAWEGMYGVTNANTSLPNHTTRILTNFELHI